jgi:hypothetical protein
VFRIDFIQLGNPKHTLIQAILARVGHHSLHSVVSLDHFAKLMVLHPHMNCLKPKARSKYGLGSVPFLQFSPPSNASSPKTHLK